MIFGLPPAWGMLTVPFICFLAGYGWANFGIMAAGFAVAAWTVQFLAGFLFGVEPLDPASFVAVGVLLTAVSVIACAIPARRAARIDALEALRR